MKDVVRFHVEPPGARDRWTALFRPILVIPHAILVGGPFVGFGAGAYQTGALGLLAITSAILDWFAILFKSGMSDGLWRFIRDVMAYALRVEAYGLLMHDTFPSFSLAEDADEVVLARQS